MRIDKRSFAALTIGAFLTLGTVACSDQRAGNNREDAGGETAATESSRDKDTIRTDNPEDVEAKPEAGATGTSDKMTEEERERQKQRDRSGSPSGEASRTPSTPNR